MIARPSRATLPSRCSFGACCEQAGYECGIQTVGMPRTSAKQSFGSDPPRFGRIAGGAPVVRSIDAATRRTHGSSGSRRVAVMVSVRAGVAVTIAKPFASRCARSAAMNVV